jgi:hypothetical protein
MNREINQLIAVTPTPLVPPPVSAALPISSNAMLRSPAAPCAWRDGGG